MSESVENIARRIAEEIEATAKNGASAEFIGRRVKSAIRRTALRRALERTRVRVKALEWDEPERGFTLRRATTPFGYYITWTHSETQGVWFWSFRYVQHTFADRSGKGASEAEVQSAAQADFARRVQACLEGEEG